MKPRRPLIHLALGLASVFALASAGCGDDPPVDPTCGDGVREGAEACDGSQFGANSCQSEGFTGGTLACTASCTLDVSACEGVPAGCGNSALDAGETCDGALLDGESCTTQGFAGGTLACNDTCTDFNTSACTPADEVTVCQELAPLPNNETCAVVAGGAATLLTGDVLTVNRVFRGGQVLVDAAGAIQCVGCDCAAQASGATTITCPTGVISPGLINAHDHITFAQNHPYDRTVERYEQRHDWRRGVRSHTEINAPGQAPSGAIRLAELRFLMGGATSAASEGGQPGFIRNLDTGTQQEGLGQPVPQTETFPLDDVNGQQRNGDCNYGANPDTAASISDDAYLGHVSEGIDAVARNEFLCVSSTTFDTMAPGISQDLTVSQSSFTHAIGFRASDYSQMAADGTGLVWSPRSNITLYGDTAVVSQAHRLGVEIALGTDWLPTGSMNMLRELACADAWNRDYLDNAFTDADLWRMATINVAAITATDDAIGAIAVGHIADLAIFNGAVNRDHRAVIAAGPGDVVLVMRGGEPLYGDSSVMTALPGTSTCETLPTADANLVCGVAKHVCVESEVGQTYAQLLASHPGAYRMFDCEAPEDEPSCHPERTSTGGAFPDASVNGSNRYDGMPTADDTDGDGLANASDNCPRVFNPIRPVDNGVQADFDTDGEGDACDVCPLDADTTTCTVFNPNDRDGDGVDNIDDNCPDDANPDQADGDNDGKGDACDVCPADANPGAAGCPVSIYDIKDGTAPQGAAVRVSNALVTGKGGNGLFLQVKAGDVGYVDENNSGVFVFTGNSTLDDAVVVGNRIAVDATVADFFGQLQLSSVTGLTIENAAVEAAPMPISVTAAEVTTGGSRAAALEAVVVELVSTTVTAGFDANNEFQVTDASSAVLRVDDFLFLTSAPTVGDQFLVLRGVLAFRNNDSKLVPRAADDLIEGQGLAAFAPSGQFVYQGDSAVPTFPSALTVTLTTPAASDTFVPVTSSDPTVLTLVGGGVTVLAGQTTAPVLVNALMPGTVTLTATLTTARTATVTVVDPAAVPALVSLSPVTGTLISGGTQTFTVSLDIPAQGDTLITLSLNPAGAGTVPATVTVPDGMLSGSFEYVDNGSVIGDVQISATLAADTLTATLTTQASLGGLVINEVDYDMAVNPDAAEFIELYNGTGAALDLADYVLLLVNGSNGTVYRTVALAGAGSLPADSYLVIGADAVTAPGGIKYTPPVGDWPATDAIQNGAPDGILLANLTTETVVDVLAYEGALTAMIAPYGTVVFDEGAATAAVDGPAGFAESLCRLPDGQDTDHADVDWGECATPTPGVANQ